MVRWLWRATSDLPIQYAPLLAHIGRVADPLLTRLLPRQPLLGPEATEWAGLAAEHALILAERVFRAAVEGETEESQRAMDRLGGTSPDLSGGLLPSLAGILTCAGAERQCWLTAYYGAIRYGILLDRGAMWRLLEQELRPVEQIAARVRRLAARRACLNDLEQRESADERTKGLSRDERWNYPSLARWDRGRLAVDYFYGNSQALLAEAQGMDVIDPDAAAALFQQARTAADQATRLYRALATQTGKWDRTVYGLLHQGLIELVSGAPIMAATYMVAAADEAVRGTVEMKTPRLALECQVAVVNALRDVTPDVARAGERWERMQALAEQIERFAETCRGYPAADRVHWVRDLEGMSASATRDSALASHVQVWRTSFIGAVEDLALVQDPEARQRVHAALQRIAPDRPSASSSSSPPRRHGRRRGGDLAPDGTDTPS